MAFSFTNLKTFPACFCFLLVIVLPCTNSVYFNISRFGPDVDDIISYQGDQKVYSGVVEMTNIDYKNRVGWVTYSNKILIWSARTRQLTDFSTRFSFNIDTRGSPNYGHGFVFFLAPAGVTIPANSGGGFLGLFNTSTTDSSQIVTVEFDTFANIIDGWDPAFQHVGINNNSISSSNYTFWNASVHSGDTTYVLITYNSTTKNLSVSWTFESTNDPRENSSLSYIIDLTTVLPEWVTAGFSAATGVDGNVERNYLQSWEFNSSLDNNKVNEKSSKRRTAIVVSVATAVCVLITALVAGILMSRKSKHRRRAENTTSINEDLERKAGPQRFSYQELTSATNNFSNYRKLGEGGFGAVYKGYLSNLDLTIAVKKFTRGSAKDKRSYITEVKTISQLRHRNLVQLIGWCHDRGEFLLVYELMPKGSLDSHLFGKIPLAWAIRYRIACGLASALLYLHEEWEQCVLHRDIKASNVMLDSSFNVKLGDFGLAILMDHELRSQTTGLEGTLGYLAPETINTGRASKESDVYSFGVVLLEIVTGRYIRKPISEDSDLNLLDWVWELYGNGNLRLGVDERLHENFDQTQAECLMVVGLWCAHRDRSLRPSMRQAMHLLNFEAPLPDLPPRVVDVHNSHQATTTPSVDSGNIVTFSSMDVGR